MTNGASGGALTIVAWVAGAYVLGVVAFSVVVHGWRAREGDVEPGTRLAKAALVEILWALPIELLLAPAFLFWPPWWRRPRRPDEVPLLFLHGYGQNRADFFPLALRLRARGHGSLHAMNYAFFRSVRHSAERLGREVTRIRARTGAPRVHIVAFEKRLF